MGQKRVKKIAGDEPSQKEGKVKAVSKSKKKVKKTVKRGQAHIQSTYNNTMITLTDMEGNVLSWSTAGLLGFKGAKKATPYAASIVVREAVEKAREIAGLEEVEVYVKGIGSGRASAIRALAANNLAITSINDVTPIPHNGCRPPKVRRV